MMASTSHSGRDITRGSSASMAHEGSARQRSTVQSTPGRLDGRCGKPHIPDRGALSVDVSFGTIWEAIAMGLPRSVAISEPGRDYTFAEFDDRAARLAAALESAGVGPGDKVACYLY